MLPFSFLTGFALLALVAGTARAQQSSFAEVESKVTEFTLKNGMKFIVLERHRAPVASFLIYADVGDANDPKGQTGMAHLFEHMAFKGSENIGTTDVQKERVALERVDRAFLALRAERRKGRKADPTRLKQLADELSNAQKEAGKYVVTDEFGDVIERAGGRGLDAFTAEDATNYFFQSSVKRDGALVLSRIRTIPRSSAARVLQREKRRDGGAAFENRERAHRQAKLFSVGRSASAATEVLLSTTVSAR